MPFMVPEAEASEVAGPEITSLEVYADPTITTRDQMRFHVTAFVALRHVKLILRLVP